MPGPLLLMYLFLLLFTIPPQYIRPDLKTRLQRRAFNSRLRWFVVFAYWVAVIISFFTTGAFLGGWVMGTLVILIGVNVHAVHRRVHAVHQRELMRQAATEPIWTEEDIRFVRSLGGHI